MTITLELSKRLERKLSGEAARLGLPLEQYALKLLGGLQVKKPGPASGVEVVEYWRREGVIGARPDITDSGSHARRIRHRATSVIL